MIFDLSGRRDLIGADMLGDPARLAGDDVGAADRVEQAGLAVVDMAHDRDHRRPRLQRLGRVDVGLDLDVDVGFADPDHAVAEFLDQQLGRVLVDRLGDGDRRAHLEQGLDQVGAALGHAVGELLDGDRLGDDDVAHLLGGRPGLLVGPLLLLAGAAERGEAAGAAVVLVGQGAGDGELAGVAAVVAAARPAGPARGAWRPGRGAWAGRGPGGDPRPRRRRPGAGAASAGRAGSSAARRASSSASQAGGFGALFLGAAILLGAALLFLGRLGRLLVLAPARFLERVQARFLGLAKQFVLQLAAGGGVVDRALRRGRLRRRLGGLRGARGRGGRLRRLLDLGASPAPRPGRGCGAS